MANLDALLLKGPPGADVVGGLDQLRETVLSNGIPSNSDGMVSAYKIHSIQWLMVSSLTSGYTSG